MLNHKQTIFSYSKTKYLYFVLYKKNISFFKTLITGIAAPESQYLQTKNRK